MQNARIRPAQKSDCRRIAELYLIASDGVSAYVWSRMAEDGEDLLDAGQRRYEQETPAFSYHNTSVVEIDDEVIGMLVAFPTIIDEDRVESDPVLAPYSKLEEPDSYYVCAMAVVEECRGQGIGRQLLELAEEQARERALDKLSLIVFAENRCAKRLYERSGYQERGREAVVPHPLIRLVGDAVLMVKELRA